MCGIVVAFYYNNYSEFEFYKMLFSLFYGSV